MRGVGVIRKIEQKLGLNKGTYGPNGEGSPWRVRTLHGTNGEFLEAQVVRIHGNETLATYTYENSKRPGREAKRHIARLITEAHTASVAA